MLHTYGDGEVTVRFIAAKVKVAPTKATSVPRSELVTAVLGLRLAGAELLEIPFENYTPFTTCSISCLFSASLIMIQ